MSFDYYLEIVNDSLKRYIPSKDGYNDTAVDAALYSLLGGGKRLRPIICLGSCQVFSHEVLGALPFAAALEMIHTYSLIHDDLPAMDDDDYRRGRASCHKKFPEWAALLAGDALLNTAFEVMIEATCKTNKEDERKRKLSALKIIGRASGIYGMIGGQTADLEWEGKSPTEIILTDICLRKTGALISASFEAGAVLGGSGTNEQMAFGEAGRKIGLAFQIKDDMLDCDGNFENTGKLSGSDEKNNKATFITVLGHEKCRDMIKNLSDEAVSLIKGVNGNTGFLEELIIRLIDRNH